MNKKALTVHLITDGLDTQKTIEYAKKILKKKYKILHSTI